MAIKGSIYGAPHFVWSDVSSKGIDGGSPDGDENCIILVEV